LSLLLCSTLAAACGNTAGQNDGQPYVTLTGQIQSSLTNVQGAVRTAVVWEVASQNEARVSQEIVVGGSFPASFTLPITVLPPEAAMQDAQPGEGSTSRYAIGTLVVYEDTNGNGKLDLVALDEPAVDRILGTLPDEALFYFEGAPPPAADFMGLTTSSGFNLVAIQEFAPNPEVACEPGCPQQVTRPWSVVPFSTPLSIQLTGSPALSSLLCGTDTGAGAIGGGPASLPPTGAQVTCSADGNAYEWSSCPAASSPCDAPSCTLGWGTRDAGTTPAGWPCP
jgi:hypothetical protein